MSLFDARRTSTESSGLSTIALQTVNHESLRDAARRIADRLEQRGLVSANPDLAGFKQELGFVSRNADGSRSHVMLGTMDGRPVAVRESSGSYSVVPLEKDSISVDRQSLRVSVRIGDSTLSFGGLAQQSATLDGSPVTSVGSISSGRFAGAVRDQLLAGLDIPRLRHGGCWGELGSAIGHQDPPLGVGRRFPSFETKPDGDVHIRTAINPSDDGGRVPSTGSDSARTLAFPSDDGARSPIASGDLAITLRAPSDDGGRSPIADRGAEIRTYRNPSDDAGSMPIDAPAVLLMKNPPKDRG